MRLAVDHSSIGTFGFLVQPQLIGPMLGDLLSLATPSGRSTMAILYAVR